MIDQQHRQAQREERARQRGFALLAAQQVFLGIEIHDAARKPAPDLAIRLAQRSDVTIGEGKVEPTIVEDVVPEQEISPTIQPGADELLKLVGCDQQRAIEMHRRRPIPELLANAARCIRRSGLPETRNNDRKAPVAGGVQVAQFQHIPDVQRQFGREGRLKPDMELRRIADLLVSRAVGDPQVILDIRHMDDPHAGQILRVVGARSRPRGQPIHRALKLDIG